MYEQPQKCMLGENIDIVVAILTLNLEKLQEPIYSIKKALNFRQVHFEIVC